MDQILQDLIRGSLAKGDFFSLIAYAIIYYSIWKEVRGLKAELHTLNTNVSNSLIEGEKRFEKIEREVEHIDKRLTIVEIKNNKLERMNKNGL